MYSENRCARLARRPRLAMPRIAFAHTPARVLASSRRIRLAAQIACGRSSQRERVDGTRAKVTRIDAEDGIETIMVERTNEAE
jgi:hypothetical protein